MVSKDLPVLAFNFRHLSRYSFFIHISTVEQKDVKHPFLGTTTSTSTMDITAGPSRRRCFTEPTLTFNSAFEEEIIPSAATDDFLKTNTPAQVLDKLKSARYTREASASSKARRRRKAVSDFGTTPLVFNFDSLKISAQSTVQTIPEESSSSIESEDDASQKSAPDESLQSSVAMTMYELLDLIPDEEWEQVEIAIANDPSLATSEVSTVIQGENSKCLLVHLMCARRKTPLSIIEKLVSMNPSALAQQESRGNRLPLHICLFRKSTPDIVGYILQQNPQAVHHADSEGNLPIHYAAMYSCPQVWNLILQANPNGCLRANEKQKYPLHLMCARCFGYDITRDEVLSCVDANPAAIQSPDGWGRLPLHLACQGHPLKDVIQVLVEVYPEALLQADSSNDSPYDLVRRHYKDDTRFVATIKAWTVMERRKKYTGFFGFFHHHMTHHNHHHHKRKVVQIESF
jgi:ankyrin repeat protein